MLETAYRLLGGRPCRGCRVESLEGYGRIREPHAGIEIEGLREPVVERHEFALSVDHGIPFGRIACWHCAEDKLMDCHSGEKDVPPHRAGVSTQQVLRHANAGKELIAALAQRLQL